jgi:heat shock protein HtpX
MMTRFVNHAKTALFLGLLFGLILFAGRMLGGTTGLVLAFLLGGAGNLFVFFYSDKIAVKSMRGQEVTDDNAPDLMAMVRRLSQNAGVPVPKVYICPQQAPNAFATGRSPNHAAIAVTRGALQLLSPDELEGVLAHELAHVKNRDTLISTVAATIAGALSAMTWLIWFIPIGGDEDSNPLALLVFLILAPIAAAIIQMAISRSREFVADADGAAIAGTPDGLINALQKLDNAARRVPMEHENPSQNHMFIVQPLNAGAAFAKLFSSHPPIDQRIAKLRQAG